MRTPLLRYQRDIPKVPSGAILSHVEDDAEESSVRDHGNRETRHSLSPARREITRRCGRGVDGGHEGGLRVHGGPITVVVAPGRERQRRGTGTTAAAEGWARAKQIIHTQTTPFQYRAEAQGQKKGEMPVSLLLSLCAALLLLPLPLPAVALMPLSASLQA